MDGEFWGSNRKIGLYDSGETSGKLGLSLVWCHRVFPQRPRFEEE